MPASQVSDKDHFKEKERSIFTGFMLGAVAFDGEKRMSEVHDLINRMSASLETKIKSSQVLIAPATLQIA